MKTISAVLTIPCLVLLAIPVLAETVQAKSAFARTRSATVAPERNGLAADAGNWRADLVKAGVLSDRGPFRVGVPIATFGTGGPRLSLAYVPKLADGVGSRVVMFVVKASID